MTACQAAHNELELIEKKVLQKMHPEDAADHKEADPGATSERPSNPKHIAGQVMSGTSFVTHRGSYSDFEGSDAGEAVSNFLRSSFEKVCLKSHLDNYVPHVSRHHNREKL